MELYKVQDFLKRHKIAVLFLVIFLAALYSVSKYSYINVEVGSSGGGDYSYSLLNQESQKSTVTKTSSNKIKKLVPKGSYEVLVKSNDSSSFNVIKTDGFLTTAKLNVSLAPEKSRSFIGDNPSPCLYMGEMLYSYSCRGTLETLQQHIPATSKQPTFVSQNKVAVEDDIEGFIKIGGSDFLMSHIFNVEREAGSPHVLYPLKDGLKTGDYKKLSGLDEARTYSVKKYKDGFLAYDDLFESIIYYASTDSLPETIALSRPADQDLKPYLFDARGDTLVGLYPNNTEGEVANLQNPSDNVKNEVFVRIGDSEKNFSINGAQYSAIKLCGNSRLCLLNQKGLMVYDISAEKKAELEYIVTGVDSMDISGGKLLAVRGNEILNLDIDKRSGAIDYSLNDYEICGAAEAESGYLLCLINSENKKVALRIDSKAINKDSIDKKIASLLKTPEVEDVSIYKNLIYISPDLGELVYIPSEGGYGYNPERKRIVSSKINARLTELGIDRKTYTVINTLD